MRIAILDYRLVPTNAIGNGNRRVIAGLKDHHDFTAFGLEIENPDPARVGWLRAPTPQRPLFLLFVAYHVWAALALWREQRRQGRRFDLVQSVESNTLLGDVLVVGFCHRAYLRDHWAATRPAGLRGVARWLDHVMHSLLEPLAFRRARLLVVPSSGLERELLQTYGRLVQGKTVIIPFAVDGERMRRPADFERDAKRASLGAGPDDLLMVFTALGHFERKGLPLLLEGMASVAAPNLKLVVVGGQPGTVQEYEKRAAALGLSGQVTFVGHQQDVRPFLWAADLFAFPSSYETFSLVTFEAAAAGLPLLVSQLHGVEDMLRDGENGWLVQRDAAGIAARIRLALQDPARLRAMGARAAECVGDYDEAHFVQRWAALYDDYAKRR
ncbi:MAG: glycosyltransferase family 4 protein [Anaerolineae bacterium]|nr:glycosyltransferase family 4 protein [Anaerolineae bacterium]